MNAIQRWASNQEKAMAEVKMDVTIMKDSIQEIRELLRHSKKNEKRSEGGENSINDEGKRKEISIHYNITNPTRKGMK